MIKPLCHSYMFSSRKNIIFSYLNVPYTYGGRKAISNYVNSYFEQDLDKQKTLFGIRIFTEKI